MNSSEFSEFDSLERAELIGEIIKLRKDLKKAEEWSKTSTDSVIKTYVEMIEMQRSLLESIWLEKIDASDEMATMRCQNILNVQASEFKSETNILLAKIENFEIETQNSYKKHVENKSVNETLTLSDTLNSTQAEFDGSLHLIGVHEIIQEYIQNTHQLSGEYLKKIAKMAEEINRLKTSEANLKEKYETLCKRVDALIDKVKNEC